MGLLNLNQQVNWIKWKSNIDRRRISGMWFRGIIHQIKDISWLSIL